MSLKGRSLLTLKDFTAEEIGEFLTLAEKVKAEKAAGIFPERLKHKNVALIFEKLSTRTRCAFAVACADEGAKSEFLSKADIHLGKKEDVRDTARVLGKMFDGIEFRGFDHKIVETLAQYSGVPVWNGLTDDDHPTQALADVMTIKERLGRVKGVRLVYVGDGRNNVANALMIISSKLGLDYRVVTPARLAPDAGLVKACAKFSDESGGEIKFTSDISGVDGADVIYTDVWVSMGEEAQEAERKTLLNPYQVNAALMAKTSNPNCLFLHCLPAVKNNEVTEEIFESPNSAVFQQAENRLHTIKAVMIKTLKD